MLLKIVLTFSVKSKSLAITNLKFDPWMFGIMHRLVDLFTKLVQKMALWVTKSDQIPHFVVPDPGPNC